jgi:LacI family transcriptional regulator
MVVSLGGASRPTAADVGRLAGVSPTTVSFVLTNRPDQTIPAATRRRVMDAVRELGYRPNRAAQGLRTKRTATIGYVTDEAAVDPFAGGAISGAHDFARRHRSMLLVVHTNRDPRIRRSAIEDLLDRQVDAILFAVVGTRRVTLPEIVVKVPAVLVNCFTAQSSLVSSLPVVLPDEEGGGYAAASELLTAGHRQIALLLGAAGAWATRKRLRGIRRALREAGVDPRALVIRHGNFRADSGYELAKEVLNGPHRPSALLCGNDRMAVGAYLALGEAGLSIPDDVSVIGYDDQADLAADLRPALTTVRLPYYELGSWAAEQVLSPAPAPNLGPHYRPCLVVRRASVAPAAVVQHDLAQRGPDPANGTDHGADQPDEQPAQGEQGVVTLQGGPSDREQGQPEIRQGADAPARGAAVGRHGGHPLRGVVTDSRTTGGQGR